jgi:adenine-specific DNA-methyltransferase
MVARSKKLEAIRSALGEPAAEFNHVMVYQGNCIDLMRQAPPNLVDLTVTSPPYNIGKEYEEPLPLSEYVAWCEKWMSEIHRSTTPTGAFWLNLGYISVPGRAKAVPLPYLLWEKNPFYLVQEVVWNYGAGVAGRKFFSPRNEKWLWSVKNEDEYVFNLDSVRDPDVKYPNQRKNGKLRVNQLGKNPSDVWQIPKVTTGADRTGRRASPERTAHPAQFPEAVLERIVRACSNPGDLVFDPFGGSGTAGAVAMAEGRECLIFEIKPDYVRMTMERLRKEEARLAVRQPLLLAE